MKLKPATAATSNAAKYTLFFVNAVFLGLLAYFSWTTVHSSDDYWYSTFWDNGLKHYLEMLDYHYRYFNGRTQVHILAQLILHFENWAFALACCGLCMAAILAVCRAAQVSRHQMPAVTGLFLAGVLLMPTSVFAQGMMWISAFCNYLYPVTLLCALILVYERCGNRALLFAVSFLCGATTEQMGLTAVAVTTVYAVDALIRRRDFFRNMLAVAFSAMGLVTIFLSPATQSRAMNSVHLKDLLRVIPQWLETACTEATLLTENAMPLVMMMAFLLLAAGFLWPSVSKRIILAVSVVGAAGLIMWLFEEEHIRTWGAVAVFVALAFQAVMVFTHGERVASVLMLAAFVSCAVILPVDSIGPRLMVPFCVLTVLSVCILWARCSESRLLNSRALWILLVITVVCLLPAIRGYWHNYEIGQMNKAFVEEDRDLGVLRYRADFDYDYTWIGKVHTNTSYQKYYLQSVGLPEDTRMIYFSGDDDLHYLICNGEQLDGYAVAEHGTTYFPLRMLVEYFGGTVKWNPEYITIDLNGISYVLRSSGETAHMTWTDPNGLPCEVTFGMLSFYGVSYCSERFLTEILAVSVQYDAAQNCYYLTA